MDGRVSKAQSSRGMASSSHGKEKKINTRGGLCDVCGLCAMHMVTLVPIMMPGLVGILHVWKE